MVPRVRVVCKRVMKVCAVKVLCKGVVDAGG